MSEEKRITMDDIHREMKKREIKEAISTRYQAVKEFVGEHKTEIITLLPTATLALNTALKTVNKRNDQKKEERSKKRTIYDARLGHYWTLKRDLSTKEYLEIDLRMRNGERMADILSDMRVLK